MKVLPIFEAVSVFSLVEEGRVARVQAQPQGDSHPTAALEKQELIDHYEILEASQPRHW